MAPRIRYERLPTEAANRASRALDRLSSLEIARLMNREDRRAVAAVGRVARSIARAVDLIVDAFGAGGRLIFVGAGTSGRLGVLEAAECPPTFNTRPGLVQAVMAGGRASVFRSREGAEDDARAGARAVRARARAGDWENFPNGREPLYHGSHGSIQKYSSTLSSSFGFGDSLYIGYSPGNGSAANPWSIRASTTNAGTNNVHRPPKAGCM